VTFFLQRFGQPWTTRLNQLAVEPHVMPMRGSLYQEVASAGQAATV
jgi:hypothetical protein